MIDPLVGSALVGAGGALLSGLLGFGGQSQTNDVNLQAVRETNQAQMDLAKYQYEKNLEQWNRENAYNSPSAQMSRLASAGLNPHLVYEKGNAITPAAQSPKFEAPNLQAYHQDASPMGVLGKGLQDAAETAFNNYMVSKMNAAKVDNLNYQNEKLYQEALTEESKRGLMTLQKIGQSLSNKQKRILNSKYAEILNSQLANTVASTKNLYSSAALSDANTLKATEELDLIKAQVYLADTAAQLNNAERQKIAQFIKESNVTIKHLYSAINANNAQAAYYNALKLKAEAEAKWIGDHGVGKNMIDTIINLAEKAPKKVADIFRAWTAGALEDFTNESLFGPELGGALTRGTQGVINWIFGDDNSSPASSRKGRTVYETIPLYEGVIGIK